MDKLNKTLRDTAINLGLCEQWQREWEDNWDADKMAFKFFEGIDFCLSNRFPSNDFIKENFNIELLHKWNIIVDEKRSILNSANAAVFGSSYVTSRYNARNCGRIYVRDNACLNITAHNNAFVIVHILDNAKVLAVAYEKADLILIKHSAECSITSNEKVKILEEFNLY